MLRMTHHMTIAALAIVSACALDPQGSTPSADGDSARKLPILVTTTTTPGSYVVFASPTAASRVVLCTSGTAADCNESAASAQILRWFAADDGAKVFTSKPLALEGEPILNLVSLDAAGTRTAERGIRFTKSAVGAGAPVALELPKERQVFQRTSTDKGKVTLRFRLDAALAAKVGRARLTGTAGSNNVAAPSDWQEFPLTVESGVVTAAIDAPAGGWFGLEMQVLDAGKANVLGSGAVRQVGIGEVFLVAGQSNSSNCGRAPQKVDNDFVVSTNGEQWQKGDDPQLGTHDDHLCNLASGHGGSNWPVTGNALVRTYKVPVAFASTGYSGTAIRQWLPTETAQPEGDDKGQSLFNYSLTRAKQLAQSGVRAVLWHQGENDAKDKTTREEYQQRLGAVIDGMRKQSAMDSPWLIAVASWCKPGSYGPEWTGVSEDVTGAQRDIVANRVLPKLYAGPATDDLEQTYRGAPSAPDDCHFNDAGLKEVGARWAQKIEAFIAAP